MHAWGSCPSALFNDGPVPIEDRLSDMFFHIPDVTVGEIALPYRSDGTEEALKRKRRRP